MIIQHIAKSTIKEMLRTCKKTQIIKCSSKLNVCMKKYLRYHPMLNVKIWPCSYSYNALLKITLFFSAVKFDCQVICS